jgi:acyl dehydratase
MQDEPDTISLERLGRYTLAKTYHMTPRPMMAFAAGVGDLRDCYFNDLEPERLIGHPGMVYTFQFQTWHQLDMPLSARAEEFNIHAWTDVRFERPFRLNDVIVAQGRVIAVKQIRPGALLVIRTSMLDSSGATVAEMDDGLLFPHGRTDGPDGEIAPTPPLPARAQATAEPAWERSIPVPQEATYIYTETAQIWDRFHTELSVAKRSGLDGLILQGSATMSYAIRHLTDACLEGDPTRLSRIAGRFRAMVTPGASMTLRCLESRLSEDGGSEVFFDVRNHLGEAAIDSGVLVTRPAGRTLAAD